MQPRVLLALAVSALAVLQGGGGQGFYAVDERAELVRYAPEMGYEYQGPFILKYSSVTNGPSWTLERLTSANVAPSNAKRDGLEFASSPKRGSAWRATNKDYANTGWDKGHLAAAANYAASQTDMASTFTLDNAVPQNPVCNEQGWAALEAHVRGLCEPGVVVYVVTIPIFEHGEIEAIGAREVWVPTHIAKSILVERGGNVDSMQSYLLPNAPIPAKEYSRYKVPTWKVERMARLDLWAALPDSQEKRLEDY